WLACCCAAGIADSIRYCPMSCRRSNNGEAPAAGLAWPCTSGTGTEMAFDMTAPRLTGGRAGTAVAVEGAGSADGDMSDCGGEEAPLPDCEGPVMTPGASSPASDCATALPALWGE